MGADPNEIDNSLPEKYIDVIDGKKHSLEISNWLEFKI